MIEAKDVYPSLVAVGLGLLNFYQNIQVRRSDTRAKQAEAAAAEIARLRQEDLDEAHKLQEDRSALAEENRAISTENRALRTDLRSEIERLKIDMAAEIAANRTLRREIDQMGSQLAGQARELMTHEAVKAENAILRQKVADLETLVGTLQSRMSKIETTERAAV